MQQIEPAVALDIKDQVEFGGGLVRQEMTALDSSGVQQHVNAPATLAHLIDDGSDAVRVRQVDAEIVRRAACGVYGIDCALRSLRPLERGQLFFDQRGRGPLATRL